MAIQEQPGLVGVSVERRPHRLRRKLKALGHRLAQLFVLIIRCSCQHQRDLYALSGAESQRREVSVLHARRRIRHSKSRAESGRPADRRVSGAARDPAEHDVCPGRAKRSRASHTGPIGAPKVETTPRSRHPDLLKCRPRFVQPGLNASLQRLFTQHADRNSSLGLLTYPSQPKEPSSPTMPEYGLDGLWETQRTRIPCLPFGRVRCRPQWPRRPEQVPPPTPSRRPTGKHVSCDSRNVAHSDHEGRGSEDTTFEAEDCGLARPEYRCQSGGSLDCQEVVQQLAIRHGKPACRKGRVRDQACNAGYPINLFLEALPIREARSSLESGQSGYEYGAVRRRYGRLEYEGALRLGLRVGVTRGRRSRRPIRSRFHPLKPLDVHGAEPRQRRRASQTGTNPDVEPKVHAQGLPRLQARLRALL